MAFSKKHLTFLFAVFFISILIRIPTLNRPLSKHHEFCTAVALRILQVWDKAGISTYNFNPVMTYPNLADKFINNYASGSGEMMDAGGNYYYTSHPPFAYYLPYYVFKFLRIKPDVFPLQLFNLFVHLLCGIGVYLILFQLNPQDSGEKFVSAWAGYVAYMFSPGSLWFHSNVYMSDILVQLFFIYGTYFVLCFSEGKNKKWLILLGITSFLMMYTSWLGVFFCTAVVTMNILKKDLAQAIIVGGCTAVALILTIFQYFQIAGWDALKHEWLVRFSERSGWNSVAGMVAILKNYLTSYLPLIVAIPALLFFFFKQIKHSLDKRLTLFIFLSAMPVVLLHVVLSNYSGHDFTTLYGGLLLSVMFGLSVQLASEKLSRKLIITGLLLFSFINTLIYYYINRPGEYSFRHDRYAEMRDIGKAIAANCSGDEVIFLNGMKPSPEIVFYAGRNILQVQDDVEAKKNLEKYSKEKGVIFRVTGGNKISGMSRINLNEPH